MSKSKSKKKTAEQVPAEQTPPEAEQVTDGPPEAETAEGVQPFTAEAEQVSDAEKAEAEKAEADAAAKAEADAKAEAEAEAAKYRGEGPTDAPHADTAETVPPEGDTATVRGWLLAKAEAAKTSVFNAVVDYGYRIRLILAFGQFTDSAEAFEWVRTNLGTAPSTAAEYVRCYRIAVESPAVAEQVQTVDGLSFLAQFSAEERTMIVTVARKAIGGERSLPVSALSDAAEKVSDAFGEKMAKQRERAADREKVRAEAKAEAAKAEADTAAAKAEAAKGATAEADGAEADGAAIQTNPKQTDAERQHAYNGLKDRNAMAFLFDRFRDLHNGADAVEVLCQTFENGLTLGGAFGPQTLVAFRLMRSEAKVRGTSETDPFGTVTAEGSAEKTAEQLAEQVNQTAEKVTA